MSRISPDAHEAALLELLKGGLTSQKIVSECLRHWTLAELATFLIDLEFSTEMRMNWFSIMELPQDRREAAMAALHTALDNLVAEELEQIFAEFEIPAEHIIDSLSRLASDLKPEEVINLFYDHDLNAYEIVSAVRDGQNRATRLLELHNFDNVCQDPHSLFETYCSSFNIQDQLTILHLLDLKPDALTLFSQALGVFPHSLRDFSPSILTTKVQSEEFKRLLPILLQGTSKESLMRILESREFARARWFQTVGPNVSLVFGGVLSKPVPCLPGTFGIAKIPGIKRLQFPDFEIVVYDNNRVRARHIGRDGVLSTEEETHTIYHYYEGAIAGSGQSSTIELKEVSTYEPDPKRPSLGDLSFQHLNVSENGLEASLRWKTKDITLKWSPGF